MLIEVCGGLQIAKDDTTHILHIECFTVHKRNCLQVLRCVRENFRWHWMNAYWLNQKYVTVVVTVFSFAVMLELYHCPSNVTKWQLATCHYVRKFCLSIVLVFIVFFSNGWYVIAVICVLRRWFEKQWDIRGSDHGILGVNWNLLVDWADIL